MELARTYSLIRHGNCHCIISRVSTFENSRIHVGTPLPDRQRICVDKALWSERISWRWLKHLRISSLLDNYRSYLLTFVYGSKKSLNLIDGLHSHDGRENIHHPCPTLGNIFLRIVDLKIIKKCTTLLRNRVFTCCDLRGFFDQIWLPCYQPRLIGTCRIRDEVSYSCRVSILAYLKSRLDFC